MKGFSLELPFQVPFDSPLQPLLSRVKVVTKVSPEQNSDHYAARRSLVFYSY